MLPSIVASEVAAALSDFLLSQFTPSNPQLEGVMRDFLNDRENLLKGPYLALDLPPQHAPEGGEPFPEIPLGFVPYRHQRTAFDRLSRGRSTVIATGTGSGKTECFLLPILDSCRKRSGEPGIKAILIYPMNALANDQAGRIARFIHTAPSLRGRVTAGIFIGQDTPFGAKKMTATTIISDRAVMVQRPPDILLTNYKMLDYLLSRPRDQRLWRSNQPNTLQWLVVDELHTFDGAQGTDLACLIRRLKARLGVAPDALTCAGTSATLGSSAGQELREYVEEVFATPFDEDSIVGETRQSSEEFLGDSLISGQVLPRPDLASLVDPAQFETAHAYLSSLCEVFFGPHTGIDPATGEGRVRIGQQLRSHATFRNLLVTLQDGPKSIGEIARRLFTTLPCRGLDEAAGIINGLCALISHARSGDPNGHPDGMKPFLNVALHLWVRELGRMVCSVSQEAARETGMDETRAEPEAEGPAPDGAALGANGSGRSSGLVHRMLQHSDDLGADEPRVFLPLIQCQTCRVTGWGAAVTPTGDRVLSNLRNFYNQFFSRDVRVRVLFPARKPHSGKGHEAALCGRCGSFRPGAPVRPCPDCNADDVVQVWVPDLVKTVRRDGRSQRRFAPNCPFCGGENDLLILGARSTVLLSAALGQVYASRYNDDHKVIAFSDNVQDAAHRAAFIAHRTWRSGKRALLAQAVPDDSAVSIRDFPGRVVRTGRSLTDGREDFVEQFIAPDRTWLQSVRAFAEDGHLEPHSELSELVEHRLEWEALAETGFAGPAAHSLQRARTAAVGPDLASLEQACEASVTRLREEIEELNEISAREVRWIALGVLRRMLQRGAIHSDTVRAVARYVRAGCNYWTLNQDIALPNFGTRSPRPVFPCWLGHPSDERGLEPVVKNGPPSWYQAWVMKVLSPEFPLLAGFHSSSILEIVLQGLEASSLVEQRMAGRFPVWAIRPERFLVSRQLRVLECSTPVRELSVPAGEAPLWQGAPCFDLGVADRYRDHSDRPPTWAGRMYREAALQRVVSEEHTALLSRGKRQRIQERFARKNRKPFDPNLLSATPTLELGIDIGDLSTVALCSVPPAQANYLQRIGRAGRQDGNAFSVTLAAARPHDLYFYADPLDMLRGHVSPPGVFLNASAVLERQLTAFCLDDWAASCNNPDAVPARIGHVLDNVRQRAVNAFPYTFFDHAAMHRDQLLQGFLTAFEGSLTEESRLYLGKFIAGEAGHSPELSIRILARLQQVADERNALLRDAQRLRRREAALRKAPADEGTERDIEEVSRERTGLQRLVRRINNRDTYGFLTDEGLLPNYAFPEEGVTLRSVILRFSPERGAAEGLPGNGSRQHRVETYEYLRPASAALSELAPANSFYAEGHRVQIDRVDLDVSKIQTWRLCPSCPHCRCIDDADGFVACPRCGDPMWADSGQVHRMLPLRLVHANTPARQAQIMDDREDRQTLFFHRQLVADPSPSAPRTALAAPAASFPFGFEYVGRTTFREMNFGRETSRGKPSTFNRRELPRVGFRVCRLCGKVQSRRSDAEPEHSWICTRADHRAYAAIPDTSGPGGGARPAGKDPDIVDCLYLYREFESESLRMLIPVADEDPEGRGAQSFIAAVELGLRERFRGKIDHIRGLLQHGTAPERDLLRNFLILYDTVPGGTGYLKELATSRTGIMDVFRAARDRLAACGCDDGCYRCLHSYRRSREQKRTSKATAISLMAKVLACESELQPIDTVDQIPWWGFVESDLEARFLRALRKRAETEPGMRLANGIVSGRRGWLLTSGQQAWTIEPQAWIGESDGVAVPSRPDFLLRPSGGSGSARPVAVFLDGFRFHRDSTGDDSLKRMALIRSRHLQWSLTWQDLEVAFGGEADAPDLLRSSASGASAPNRMTAVQERLDSAWTIGPLRRQLRLSSFDLLMLYLRNPDPEAWRKAVFVDFLRLFDPVRMREAEFRACFESCAKGSLPRQARDGLLGDEGELFLAGSGPAFGSGFEQADILVSLPPAAITGMDADGMAVALHLHDESPEAEGYQDLWNGVLRLFNLIQFLSAPWWSTTAAVKAGVYPDFAGPAASPKPLGAGWEQAVEEADPCVQGLLREVAVLGALPPDTLGYELTGPSGRVVGEAEAAWTQGKVALLRRDQIDSAPAFSAEGWTVFDEDAGARSLQAAVALDMD